MNEPKKEPLDLIHRKERFPEMEVIDSASRTYEGRSITFHRDLHSVDQVIFKNCHFQKNIVSDFSFKSCTFVDCSLVSVRFEEVEFHDCELNNCLLLKPKFRRTYIDPSSFIFDFNKWKRQVPNVNAWLFQELNRNSMEMFQNKFAAIAYKIHRKYLRWQNLTFNRDDGRGIWKRRSSFFIDWMYDVSMGYGYGLINAVATTCVMLVLGVVALNMLWSSLSISSNVAGLQTNTVFEKLYFLVVTSSTLGYGDLSPKNTFGMMVVVVLVIASILWTAAVTAIFVKRITK
jgi:hypothetical protein